jgi:hypothetical protein
MDFSAKDSNEFNIENAYVDHIHANMWDNDRLLDSFSDLLPSSIFIKYYTTEI